MDNWSLPHSFHFQGREVKYGIQGEGASLVIVHGTPWSSFNLRHLINRLSKHFKVHYYDLLGYGQSDQSNADVSLGIQNKLLDALMEHWELELPFVVGHDFGGTTVLRNHILNKRPYRKLVVIDPVALSPWGSAFFKHVETYEEAFAGVPDYIHAAIVETYINTAAYQPLPKATIEGTLAPWCTEQGKPAFYRQIAQASTQFTDEFQDRFNEITTPVLILWGEEDEWIPCEQAYKLQNKIAGSTLVTIPQTGHLVIEEAPDQLADEIIGFFNQ